MQTYTVEYADWQSDQAALMLIRQQVFIDEQHVPEALEWDGLDAQATHLLAKNGQGDALGCARLLDSYQLGRMAVLPDYRKRGIGQALLQFAIAHAQNAGSPHLTLSAQMHALAFYQRAGFVVTSDCYWDAGILHCDMRLLFR